MSITGGEPLVRKDLYDVVAHMTRLRMRSCIVTNGTREAPGHLNVVRLDKVFTIHETLAEGFDAAG